jgi:hypothetical protein
VLTAGSCRTSDILLNGWLEWRWAPTVGSAQASGGSYCHTALDCSQARHSCSLRCAVQCSEDNYVPDRSIPVLRHTLSRSGLPQPTLAYAVLCSVRVEKLSNGDTPTGDARRTSTMCPHSLCLNRSEPTALLAIPASVKQLLSLLLCSRAQSSACCAASPWQVWFVDVDWFADMCYHADAGIHTVCTLATSSHGPSHRYATWE